MEEVFEDKTLPMQSGKNCSKRTNTALVQETSGKMFIKFQREELELKNFIPSHVILR